MTSSPPAGTSSVSRDLRPVLVDAAVVAVWFLLAGVLTAVLWWQLVDLPEATRANGAVVVAADQIGKQVNIDGWYLVLSAAGGLLSGGLLVGTRRRDPLVMVVLVTLGGGLATLVARWLGGVLGPPSETTALRGRPDGAQALVQLHVHASGVLWVWPAAAALGAVVYLWVLAAPHDP